MTVLGVEEGMYKVDSVHLSKLEKHLNEMEAQGFIVTHITGPTDYYYNVVMKLSNKDTIYRDRKALYKEKGENA